MSTKIPALVVASSLFVVASGSAEAAPSTILARLNVAAKPNVKTKPTVKTSPDISWSTGDPAIDVAAGLVAVRAIARHAVSSTKKGAKVRAATLTRVVAILETAVVLQEQAIAESAVTATKKRGSPVRAAKLLSLRRSLVDALTVAKQARHEQSSTKLGEVLSAVTASSTEALRLAQAGHQDAELRSSAVALRLALAEAVASAANGNGTNALIGEKGANALIGGKGSGVIDAEMLGVVKGLLDEVAKDATLVSKAKPLASQLAGVRDGVDFVSKKGGSAWAMKRALQAAGWANEALIVEMQKQ